MRAACTARPHERQAHAFVCLPIWSQHISASPLGCRPFCLVMCLVPPSGCLILCLFKNKKKKETWNAGAEGPLLSASLSLSLFLAAPAAGRRLEGRRICRSLLFLSRCKNKRPLGSFLFLVCACGSAPVCVRVCAFRRPVLS